MGLLTGNFQAGAQIKLGHYRLHQFFPFGGFGDRHLCRNAVAQEAAQAARGHLGPPNGACDFWVIGDTPLDIRCARAIGARAVAVATGWHTLEQLAAEQPDDLLPDLEHFSSLLERIRSR
jgi:phosphoglycolate phosphatase-like HAD superfamily hydrolase